MSLENQNLIDAYLKGELNQTEKAAFEQKLLEDKKLKEQFEASQLMVESMQRKALKDEINQAKPKGVNGLWIAGFVLLAMIVSFVIWKQSLNTGKPLSESKFLKVETLKEEGESENQKNKQQFNLNSTDSIMDSSK
jgi:hypothetical protein